MSRTSALVELNKDIMHLADKSVWRVAPGHLSRIAEWAPGVEVTVEKSDNAMWQYKLTVPGSTGLVSATPSSGKLVLGSSMRDVMTADEMYHATQG
ncbi:hypothetical protein [Methyloferula stellata]|jgi:hypothetical protein|uniref:hypothetical protein n=1 Tax=Methyloferula stellata TaxID=876270 RepID=UPI00036774BC|nr:hypothetical protein [Methyloferula stellata]